MSQHLFVPLGAAVSPTVAQVSLEAGHLSYHILSKAPAAEGRYCPGPGPRGAERSEPAEEEGTRAEAGSQVQARGGGGAARGPGGRRGAGARAWGRAGPAGPPERRAPLRGAGAGSAAGARRSAAGRGGAQRPPGRLRRGTRREGAFPEVTGGPGVLPSLSPGGRAPGAVTPFPGDSQRGSRWMLRPDPVTPPPLAPRGVRPPPAAPASPGVPGPWLACRHPPPRFARKGGLASWRPAAPAPRPGTGEMPYLLLLELLRRVFKNL
ncbi:hypothetical protein VULLAG_LOCUS20690 [Vulpes lagopus]